MTEGRPAPIEVDSTAAVAALALTVLEPERDRPIVCISIPTWASSPLLDAQALVDALGDAAAVYVLPTGELSWDLTDRLPPRLDVYGGAVRVWWPLGDGEQPDPFEHPLFLVHDRSESDETVAKIVAALERRGFRDVERPQPGAEVGAVVTRVLPHGAELTLAGGHPAFAHASHLTRVAGLAVDRVVRVGQPVRVRVGQPGPDKPRLPVSLVPFEPDPWRRFAEQHAEGMVVEGVVEELRNVGALVQVFPGVTGLLHKSKITREWVSHPEDYLELDERIAVRIVSTDIAARRIELSCLDIPEDDDPEPPRSLYADGPPWLAEVVAEPEPPAVDAPEQAEAAPERAEAAAAAASPAAVEADAPVAEVAEGHPSVAEAGIQVDSEVERLEESIAAGRELQGHVGGLFTTGERRLAELRAEASQLLQVLDRDLTEARLRILELAESETGALVGSTEAALEEARAEVVELRARLASAENDRRELLRALKDQRERAGDAEHRSERLKQEARAARAQMSGLEAELAALDPAERFLSRAHAAWERMTPAADRERYAWRAPVLGPAFLESVEGIAGVSRERIVEVCAHVASGRARDIPGLELHVLRTSETGGAPRRERADGAKAWRCSLQANTPAARRLHFWRLPDGRVELANVAYHDDFSIA